MIRILHCVNQMNRAGLETMLMNCYRHMDRRSIQFDFLTHRPDRGEYDEEIEDLGGRIYRAPRLYPQNYPAYFAYMKAFFREHPEYRVVHSHIDAMSYLPLLAAKGAGIPVRIAHSHSTAIDRDFKYPLKQLFRHLLPGVATHCFACGQQAGAFLFGRHPFRVVPNGIDLARFRYDAALRQLVREELGLEGKLVMGHVGRLTAAKNQAFLLRIFRSVSRKEDSILLISGTGEKEKALKRLAAELGVEQRVRFLGSREDMHRLYQAMDVFLLPSLYEGVPMTGLEAQAAGVPCFFSDRVPREVAFSEGCAFLPLESDPEEWAEAIRSAAGQRYVPTDCPFAIAYVSEKLEEIYADLWKEEASCPR